MILKKVLPLIVSVSLLMAAPASAVSSGSGSSSGGSSLGSIAGFHMSLVGSVTVSAGGAIASEALIHGSLQAIEASAQFGHDMIVTSVEFVGNVAHITIQASLDGVDLASQIGGEFIEFNLAVSRQAFQASVASAEGTLELIEDGVKFSVRAVAITAGSASQLIGHTLVLAASPAVAVGVVLNDLGKQLYAQ